MALISPFPDFYDASVPAVNDFNDAGKAILQQLGGSYFDRLSGTYKQAPGNLDGNNISSNAAFKNDQKAEPFSHMAVTAQTLIRGATGGITQGEFVFGPFIKDAVALSFNTSVGPSSQAMTDLGSYDLYLNGVIVGTYYIDAGPRVSTVYNTFYSRLNIPVRCGDILFVDGTNLFPELTDGLQETSYWAYMLFKIQHHRVQ